MSEKIYPGGPVMIKIDGDKIRSIRESKGLTQLYIASVVEVTTDTVSRWENKRYPSIKQENGQKLAEALEVPLEDILDTAKNSSQHLKNKQNLRAVTNPLPEPPDSRPEGKTRSTISRRTIVLLAFILIPLIIALLYFSYRHKTAAPMSEMTVQRIMASHFIAGQPFPVFLHISSPANKSISIILKENLPPGISVESTYPEISGKRKQDRSIKWLERVSGSTVFSYMAKSNSAFQGRLSFDGVLKIGSGSNSNIPVSGTNDSTAGLHHWADSNQDNYINDEEILAVYDLISPGNLSGINMDLLEEIWLGEGYIWQPQEQRFSIIE